MADAIRISVKADFTDIQRMFARLDPAAIAKASAVALNKTAEQAKSEVNVSLPRIFDRPTPYTLGALRTINATQSSQKAEVTFQGAGGRGISAHKFLAAEATGGRRRDKASEKLLQAKGILPAGWHIAPGPAAQLDPYGNMKIGELLRILAFFQTFTSARGARSNLSAERAAKRKKGTRKTYGYEYFAMRPGEKWPSGRAAQPGIYKRTFIGTGARGGSLTAIDLMLTFIRPASYTPRLQFIETIQRVVARDMAGNFKDAFSKAPTS